MIGCCYHKISSDRQSDYAIDPHQLEYKLRMHLWHMCWITYLHFQSANRLDQQHLLEERHLGANLRTSFCALMKQQHYWRYVWVQPKVAFFDNRFQKLQKHHAQNLLPVCSLAAVPHSWTNRSLFHMCFHNPWSSCTLCKDCASVCDIGLHLGPLQIACSTERQWPISRLLRLLRLQ